MCLFINPCQKPFISPFRVEMPSIHRRKIVGSREERKCERTEVESEMEWGREETGWGAGESRR